MNYIKNRQIIIDCNNILFWGVDMTDQSDSWVYIKYDSKYDIQEYARYCQGIWKNNK